MSGTPLIAVRGLGKTYGRRVGCVDVSFDLFEGEVIAVVGESGSGKSTLLGLLATEIAPTAGAVRRYLLRTDWGFVRQDARDGLRMNVSAGGNVGERLMAVGARHYGNIRAAALDWLGRVEIDGDRIDDL